MLIEIRRYTIVPGRRAEFVEWFEGEVVPAMISAGMRILGSFEAVDDSDGFLYIRGFVDEAERERQTAAFYADPAWTDGMKDTALALERDHHVDMYISTPRSAL